MNQVQTDVEIERRKLESARWAMLNDIACLRRDPSKYRAHIDVLRREVARIDRQLADLLQRAQL